MGKINDITGKRFGRLTALRAVGKRPPRRHIRWECLCDCGTIHEADGVALRTGNTLSCGCVGRESARERFIKLRRGRRPSNYKGWRVNNSGYVLVRCPEHPAVDANGYVREHRLVMERILGRYLAPNENVHHKNGIRTDNSSENLELWVVPQPPGQRAADLNQWAAEEFAETLG